jgi:hypothetical protein
MISIDKIEKLPQSIFIHIMEFAAEREIKNILDDIKLKGIILSYHNIQKFVNNQITYNKYASINELRNYKRIIDKNLINYDAESSIVLLNKCNCCLIHQYDKPKNINDLSWIDKNIPSKLSGKQNCRCCCRHLSREIFRLHHANRNQAVSWTTMINSYYNNN